MSLTVEEAERLARNCGGNPDSEDICALLEGLTGTRKKAELEALEFKSSFSGPKPESTDRSLTGRDAGLPESSAACRRSPGGAGGGPERRAVAQRGSAVLRARARGCAGMLARASEPGRRCERASGRERYRP